MAKRQRNHQVAASFYYLVKEFEDDDGEPSFSGFTSEEFARIVARISDLTPPDVTNEDVIRRIKMGEELPFIAYEECEPGLYFGDFEGAYYGQQYRNNVLGVIEAHTLNLRSFHYLITRLRDGKILIGVTYHGQFGDFDGLRSCFSYLLRGNYRISSKALKSVSGEIGNAVPISIKLNYRVRADRVERPSLFSTAGVIALRNSDLEDFDEQVADLANRVTGTDAQRKRTLAEIVNRGHLLELDEDDIVGCSAVVREHGRDRTIYFLGERNFATRFPLNVEVDDDGSADTAQVRSEIIRTMREYIMPLMV